MMKKKMFNDRYGMTKAVLNSRKTMFRCIVPQSVYNQTDWKSVENGNYVAFVDGDGYYHDIRRCGKYQIGEEVAVAQAYKNDDVLSFNAYDNDGAYRPDGLKRHKEMLSSAGYRNKMFVKAEYMPYRIRITDIKVELLQHIREDDCMKEGVDKWIDCYIVSGIMENHGKNNVCFDTPREAFAALIDRISGKGTWERNPWCFAYEFELIK